MELPYKGNPVIGAVGEMASVKRRKLWKTGEDVAVLLQQCHPNSAGSLVIARGTEWGPHCFCCSFVLSATPQTGGKWPRYIDRYRFYMQTS